MAVESTWTDHSNNGAVHQIDEVQLEQPEEFSNSGDPNYSESGPYI